MKILIIAIFILLALTSFCYASDGCITYTNCTYYANADGLNVTDVYITIKTSNGTELVTNQIMTDIGNETFKYDYIHNNSGNVVAVSRFYEGATFLGIVPESKEIRDQELTENNMILFGIIIAVLGTAGLLFFASTQTSTQKMTAIRRVPEKVLLYITGLLMIPTMWYFSIVSVKNNAAISYMYDPLNLFFGILILIVFALLMLYFYNMLKAFIDNMVGKKEDLDAEED